MRLFRTVATGSLRPTGRLYTPDHCWVDFSSKRCGFSPYFFEDMHLSGLNCTVSSKLKSVRKGQPIGFMYYFCPDSNREERTVIDSPVTGRVVEVNEEINRSLNWFYRFDNIDSSPEEFMDDETYRSFLMTLKA